jgi:acetyl esterase/lipase
MNSMNRIKRIVKITLFLILLFSGLGFFLSLWIIVPAPTFSLLPLAVGAPEISPWLLVGNMIAALLALSQYQHPLARVALVASLVGLLLSSLPLSQLSATHQAVTLTMQRNLDVDSWNQPHPTLSFRTQPFQLIDGFRGIPLTSVRHDSGIVFAEVENERLTLDIYRPSTRGRYPTVIVIYGGAWQNGNPSLDADFNRYMAAQGYTMIAIDYRHAPRYQFPSQILDVQTAMQFIQRHATAYEVDLNRMAVLGRSAGAQLAMLLAYQPDTTPLRAVVNYYGPVDLAAGYRNPPVPDPINTRAILDAFLGGSPEQVPDQYTLASPIHFIKPNLPPTLLVYGSRDHVVEAKYGRQLRDRLQASGNTAVLLEIPWAEHAFDAVFSGVSNQLVLYHTERFLAWALR